jgi:hypothetical protein
MADESLEQNLIKETLPFGTGCLPDLSDNRDLSYDDKVLGAAPVIIDWVKGYDIREHLGLDLPFKNQWSSGSCVGQGWAYYLAILDAIENGVMSQASAKAAYSQIFLSGSGGAYIRDGAKLICDWGGLPESVVPSNKPNGHTDEDFMRDKSWKTKELDNLAKVLRGKDYRVIQAVSHMDLFAQAILENHGVVGGVNGENNGTWMSERPKPPRKVDWAHCLYFGAFGTDSYGKFIATPNSWGNLLSKTWYPGSPVGHGWQKLYQDYFDNNGINIFNPWTFTDLPNNHMNTNVKVIKDVNSPAVGFWCPANNPDGLIAMARNYGIEIPKLADGVSIDWDKLIQGGMTLK